MKTVVIGSSLPSTSNRVAHFYLKLSGEFVRRGFRVIFFIDKKIPIDRIPNYNGITFKVFPSRRPTKVKDFLFALSVLKGQNLQLVISNFGSHNVLTIASFLLGCKNNWTYLHTTFNQTKTDFKGPKFKLYFLLFRKRLIFKLNTLFLTNSLGTKNEAIDIYKISKNKIIVLHLLIDSFFRSRVLEPGLKMCIIGRLHKSKGHITLLNYLVKFKQLNQSFKLLIVGDGPEKPTLTSFVRDNDLKDNVIFLGNRSREEIDEILSTSHLSISSSVSEAFGLVMIESFMHGTPVLCTYTEGSSEIVDNEITGCFFNNFETFKLGVDLILSKNQVLSKNCRNDYEKRFSFTQIPNHVDRITALLK